MLFCLSFAVLEAFASAGLAILLALPHARIASEKPVRFQSRTQIDIGLEQGAGNAMPDRTGLPEGAAARDVHFHVKLAGRLGQAQWLSDSDPLGLGRKITFERAPVDHDCPVDP